MLDSKKLMAERSVVLSLILSIDGDPVFHFAA